MQLGPLGLFNKTNVRGIFVLASWHWRRSITWSWGIWWHPRAKDCRLGFRRFRRTTHLNLPVLGDFTYQRQRPLWQTEAP